jgi:hypothetical protein
VNYLATGPDIEKIGELKGDYVQIFLSTFFFGNGVTYQDALNVSLNIIKCIYSFNKYLAGLHYG